MKDHICTGFLSNYYKRFLKRYLPQIPINVLYHPTEIPDLKFNFDKFFKNKNKSVVNIGWWLRKLNSIPGIKPGTCYVAVDWDKVATPEPRIVHS